MTVRTRLPLLAAAFLWMGAVQAVAAELRVPVDHPTIQGAIDAAVSGDTILVSPGTYVETIDFNDKAIDLLSTDGPGVTTIDGAGSGTVVTFGIAGDPSRIRGFTIRGGSGTMVQFLVTGGGILTYGASPVIEGNVFVANTAWNGAAIACLSGAAPRIEGNVFERNRATGFNGGAILCDNGSRPDIFRNAFRANRAVSGGTAITVIDATPVILGNQFRAHRTGWPSAAVWVRDASDVSILENDFGDELEQAISVSNTRNVRIERNRIGVDGLITNGMDAADSSGLRLYGNRFVGSQLHVRRCDGARFVGNDHDSTSLILEDCTDLRLFGCAIVDNHPTANQPEIVAVRTEMDLTHCTVIGRGSWTSRIHLYEGRVELANSIIWGEGTAFAVQSGEVTARGSLVLGGWPGEGNIDGNPRVVTGDFHLRSDSRCIDAGLDVEFPLGFDLDGDPRIIGKNPDIGADEYRMDMAVRYGNVNGRGERVLTANGQSGDYRRVISLQVHEPVSIDLEPSSAGPSPARHVVYAWLDEPDETTIRPQPFGLGWTVFPTPLQAGGGNQPVAIWNTIGHEGRLGASTQQAEPAPTRLLDLPGGLGRPVRFTLQGFLEDDGSVAEVPFSVTNALVIQVN